MKATTAISLQQEMNRLYWMFKRLMAADLEDKKINRFILDLAVVADRMGKLLTKAKTLRNKQKQKEDSPIIKSGGIQTLPTSGTTTVTQEMAEVLEDSLDDSPIKPSTQTSAKPGKKK